MNKINPRYVWAFALTLSGLLPGCATYEKCGAEGCPGDAKISALVRERLARHAEIGPLVEVQTINGVVYLTGQVNQGLQRDVADSVAQGTPGVTKVVDNIAVAH